MRYLLDVHFVDGYALNAVQRRRVAVFGMKFDIFESEVRQFVLVVGALDVEGRVARQADAAHRDVVGIGVGDVLASLQVEELRPWADIYQIARVAGDVFHGDVLVALRRVRAHLQPKQTLCRQARLGQISIKEGSN